MRLIKPNVEIIEQSDYTIDGIYKMIELAGRTCYKSEDKITEDSAKEFVNRMIKSGHGAMLEHGTVYLTIPITDSTSYRIDAYRRNKYTRSDISKDLRNYYITTNLRVLVENNWLDDLQYVCEPTEHHEKRITVKWTTDRVTGESFLRHRVFSFARESTRYCNYTKDKFDNEVKFIIPTWVDIPEGKIAYWDGDWVKMDDLTIVKRCESDATDIWLESCKNSEWYYNIAINNGWKPQQARQVLTFSIHSPLVMTGFESDWKGFFALRSPKYGAKGMHPDAAYLADKLYDLMYVVKEEVTITHHDELDGKSNFLKEGDLITFVKEYDKNKCSRNFLKAIIEPVDGEKYELNKEEYYERLNKERVQEER